MASSTELSFRLTGKLLDQCHGRASVVERPNSVTGSPLVYMRLSRRVYTMINSVSILSTKVPSHRLYFAVGVE